MSELNLAIASIPIQEWGEIYEDKEALQIGTIFKSLNKPFFAADTLKVPEKSKSSGILDGMESDEQKVREALMEKIYQTGFVLDDLTLYLDTHPQDQEAKKLYHDRLSELTSLKTQFAESYYPLTRCHIPDCSKSEANHFCWQEGPMPWEGACI